MKGTIFNIQRYALHDGPGIRTTVFFKGCPLSCKWCHNPESIFFDQELMFYKEQCIRCECCEDFSLPDRCPTKALVEVGQDLTVDQLMVEILKDKIFYETSGGGVTFSGGEPLFQSHFLLALLKASKEAGLHTVVDTCGYGHIQDYNDINAYVDLYYFDVKHVKEEAHIAGTGVSLTLIQENLKQLSKMNKVIIRVPLIKEYNDDEETLLSIMDLAENLKIEEIHFLPYHDYGTHKYERLLNKRELHSYKSPEQSKLDWILEQFSSRTITGKIGG
ncbi:MAG: glycyl-radical enzyme activating protein [Clostridia bacterium]|nr:glycyl-radical enzyme activating protein [Clostridia bacterium]